MDGVFKGSVEGALVQQASGGIIFTVLLSRKSLVLARSIKVVSQLHVRWCVPSHSIDDLRHHNLMMANGDGRLGRPCCLVEQNLQDIGQIKEGRKILVQKVEVICKDGGFKGQVCMTIERAEEKERGKIVFLSLDAG